MSLNGHFSMQVIIQKGPSASISLTILNGWIHSWCTFSDPKHGNKVSISVASFSRYTSSEVKNIFLLQLAVTVKESNIRRVERYESTGRIRDINPPDFLRYFQLMHYKCAQQTKSYNMTN